MNARDIIAAARIRTANRMPYLSAVLYSMRPVKRDGLDTIATDAGWRLHYDSKFVEALGMGDATHDGMAFGVAHEALHCLLDHSGRRHEREPDNWNRATDATINDMLIEAGFKMPPLPSTKGGLPGTGITSAALKLPPKLTSEENYELLNSKKGGEPEHKPGHKCGGCCGNAHDWESGDGPPKPGDKPGESGGSKPGEDTKAGAAKVEAVSEADKAILRRRVAEAIKSSTSAGSVPGALKAWAEAELAPPKVDWRKALAALVRSALADKAGAVDYTYNRPSRRYWGMRRIFGNAPIMPALRAPTPTVKGVLDVSGSMSGGPAESARAEIVGICKAMGAPVEFVSCDTKVVARARVSGKKDIAKLGDTGGGTSLTVGIKALEKTKPDIIVVLTDGYTDWPERGSTRAKVIAAITPGGRKAPDHIPSVMIEAN
jgi:predicted metal-dependent peptidase